MKVRLEFTLPEEDTEFRLCVDANALHLAMWDFGEWLRAQLKYTPEGMSDVEIATLARVRAHWFDVLAEHGVTLD